MAYTRLDHIRNSISGDAYAAYGADFSTLLDPTPYTTNAILVLLAHRHDPNSILSVLPRGVAKLVAFLCVEVHMVDRTDEFLQLCTLYSDTMDDAYDEQRWGYIPPWYFARKIMEVLGLKEGQAAPITKYIVVEMVEKRARSWEYLRTLVVAKQEKQQQEYE